MIAQPMFSDARMWLIQPQCAHYAAAAPLHDISQWFGPALKKVAGLSALPGDWDSYNSVPITLSALDAARRFLNNIRRYPLTEVDVIPVSGGGLALVFQHGDKALEIEVLPEGGLTFLKQGSDVLEAQAEAGSLPPFSPQASAELIDWLLAD